MSPAPSSSLNAPATVCGWRARGCLGRRRVDVGRAVADDRRHVGQRLVAEYTENHRATGHEETLHCMRRGPAAPIRRCVLRRSRLSARRRGLPSGNCSGRSNDSSRAGQLTVASPLCIASDDTATVPSATSASIVAIAVSALSIWCGPSNGNRCIVRGCSPGRGLRRWSRNHCPHGSIPAGSLA